MEPFQLLCPGCASKLKVRNRSAIGQRLACPKCRQMILVAAPEGHDIGESVVEPSFDNMDLDALLENRPPAKAGKPAQAATNTPRPKRPQRPAAKTPPPTQKPQQELAPGEDWVNPATRKKQHLIFLIMGSLGFLLATAAFVFYMLGGFGAGRKIAVVPDDKKEEIKKDLENAIAPIADPKIDVNDKEDPKPQPELETGKEPETVTVPDIGAAPNIAGIPDTPPGIPGTPDMDKPPAGFTAESPATNDANNDPLTKSAPDDPGTEREQLNSVLAESGTSLLEIQSAASVARNDFAIGTPKYFFEKISFEAPNWNQAKDQIILGVKYDQQPLQTVLHELSAISGLQLTINVPAITSAGIEINPTVSLQVENESTGAVIRKVAQEAGLAAIESDQGFVISIEPNDEFEAQDINVALIVENKEEGLELVQLVSELVYPGTWKTDPPGPDAGSQQPKGTITFADGKLSLNHSPAAIREVQKLIDGLKALGRDDVDGSPLLQPIPWIDAGSFTKEFEPMNAVRVTIGKFFRGFQDSHDVRILADWSSLAQTGWTSDAMAPSRIEERTVGHVVKETAHGMGAAYYVVDDKTVWITSPQVANNIFLLKIYPLDKLGNGRMTQPRLAQVLSDSLGSQMAQPGVRFYVLAKKKLVAVRAPQLLHRQLNAVFSQIK